MYLHYILKDCQLSDTVSTTISKVDVFTISFQLTCKFIHTSYDNTTLANAYFMSFFYLFRLYIILLHCCGIHYSSNTDFFSCDLSLLSYQSFSFIYFLTPQRGVNQKPFVPCQQSTHSPFMGRGDTFGAKMNVSPI